MKKHFSIVAACTAVVLLTSGCGTMSALVSELETRWNRAVRGDGQEQDSRGREKENIDWGSVSQEKVKTDPISHPEEITMPERDALDGASALSAVQKNLLATARSKLGCRYSYAGQGPNSFDCSGFMMYVFAKEGISLPHGSAAQYTKGRALSKDDRLKTGDLVFFSGRKISSNVGHVGMVVDYDRRTHEFTFIHAAMTGVEIQKSTAEYYALRYIGARRILPEED